jgi:hypothetical protein
MGLIGQVVVWEKSPAFVPVIPMLLIVSAAPPVLVRVTFCAALVVPVFWFPKAMLGALRLTAGAGATPVPLRATLCGLSPALSVTVRLADRAPEFAGAKETLTVQELPAPSEVGQAFVWEKSPGLVPVNPMVLIASAPVPLFVSVTDCAALVVPVVWLPKVRLDGLSETEGAVPLPERLTVCGLPEALSATEIEALRGPGAPGANVTLIVQLAPAASVLELSGQVLVWPKSALFVPVTPILVMVIGAFPLLERVIVWI